MDKEKIEKLGQLRAWLLVCPPFTMYILHSFDIGTRSALPGCRKVGKKDHELMSINSCQAIAEHIQTHRHRPVPEGWSVCWPPVFDKKGSKEL
ncbi:hypothetical protein DUNSADRAFT_12718 [Dunaliella salina]|uniref:Encoded protein n=1 Tax=Dunaliella salina TaxID=3046 RepID=A0ABQ7GAQ9_DUNSA|nr:hypothetical protein DUNSADRAFT_12718 [Dunaliella salina]|eukprot:KAF5831696.1 hypothetical protein DUNSADRAFT_12718 [Dunaliella salina]